MNENILLANLKTNNLFTDIIDISLLNKNIRSARTHESSKNIQFSKVVELAKKLNLMFPEIHLNLMRLIPMVLRNNNLDILITQLDDTFEVITEIVKMPRDVTFILMKSVYLHQSACICKKDYQIEFQTLPNEIRHPKDFKFGDFKFLRGQHRPQAKHRYVYNFDVTSAQKLINQYPTFNSIGNEANDVIREASLIRQYIGTVLNQTRSVNISRMCLAILLLSRVNSTDAFHYCNDCSKVSPFLRYFCDMFKDYEIWPFIDVELGMRYQNANKKLSSQLPLLLYSFLNRAISWNLGVITTGTFNLAANVYYEWASDSLDDNHLLQKGNMNLVRKLLNEKIKIGDNYFIYDDSGISGVDELKDNSEFWLKEEKENMLKLIKDTKTTRLYYQQIQKLLDSEVMSRDDIIKHKVALACCTNTSTFKKSTPTLEYDRSAEHKIHNPIVIPHARLIYNDFAVEPRYNSNTQIGKCWKILMSYNDEIRKDLANRDFETEFWDRLTNNSAGITTDAITRKRRDDPILLALPTIPYGQRYISAIIDNSIMYNKLTALATISEYIKAGKREQIDRRSRWIMMVSNTLQAVFSIALSYGRALTKISDFIASGKQRGDIRDMLNILSASANKFSLITDNDIKGMDSSTQEQVADMVLHAVFQSLNGLKIESFFYAKSEKVICEVRDSFGRNVGNEEVELNAAQIFITDIIAHMRSTQYDYTEGWVTDVTRIAGSVFWSGAFHTAVQHNTLLESLLQDFKKECTHKYLEHTAKIRGSVLGDDVTLEFNFSKMDSEIERAAENMINWLRTKLYDLGFEAEPESSRYQATFLQQTALLGAVEPKHARLSIVTSERSDGRLKDPIGQIKEIGDLLDELAGRSFTPENSDAVLRAFWAVTRVFTLSEGIIQNKRLSNRLNNLQIHPNYQRWFRGSKYGLEICIPYVAIHLDNVFGSPLPPINLPGHGIKRPSFYTPKGSFQYWLIMQSIMEYNENKLNKIKEDHIINKTKQIKSLYNNKKITAERYDTLINSIPGPECMDLVNNEALFNLGFSTAIWLSEKMSIITKPKLKERDNPMFGKLISVGKQKQDSAKAHSAYVAKQILKERGIDVPELFAYYNQPENRITQAFQQKKSSRSRANSNESLFDSITRTIESSGRLRIPFKDSEVLNFNIFETSAEFRLSSDSQNAKKVTFGPCCKLNSDAHTLLLLFGAPFNTPSVDVIVNTLQNDLPVGADAERVIEIAANIYRVDNSLVNAFLTYIGLPSRHFRLVNEYIKDFSISSTINYTSIYNRRKHFYSATLTTIAREFLLPNNSSKKSSKKWNRIQIVIARDWMHTFPETNTKISILPSINLLSKIF